MRIAVGIIVCVISPPLVAQWLNYPTPGIPRLADGKPNLAAPAPSDSRWQTGSWGNLGLALPDRQRSPGRLHRPADGALFHRDRHPPGIWEHRPVNQGRSALSAVGGRTGAKDEG